MTPATVLAGAKGRTVVSEAPRAVELRREEGWARVFLSAEGT